jgi:hypothetical protein
MSLPRIHGSRPHPPAGHAQARASALGGARTLLEGIISVVLVGLDVLTCNEDGRSLQEARS